MSLTFTPDSEILATAGTDNRIHLWRVADGALLTSIEGHTDSVVSLEFSADGALLASGSWDGTVRLWESRP
jgi:WD40 repeat protein